MSLSNMTKTQLNKIKIEKFRALENVEVEFGDHITVVCGKNGTSKSSILGIAAQIFSFDKDYVTDQSLKFSQITGASFKSQYSEHFRISDKYDIPGSMKVSIELTDGYTNSAATARLELMKRESAPRPVVRKNSTVADKANSSRNFTHPVIFLSLKRLYPIAARDYKVGNFAYLNSHINEFIGLTNELLNRNSSQATGTDGTICSAVAHGANYDQDSVSAGEDNAGQIALAILSFRKLKEEYPDYKGGLLLIDEADAGLFPTAQLNLLKMLDRECKNLQLQVIMTSHSPTLIEYAFEQSKTFRKRFKTIYLSNTYGSVRVCNDWSWAQINADITTKTVRLSSSSSLPRVNVYFEDSEAEGFFNNLMYRQPIKKFINPMTGITLGCSNYIQLIQKKVPEFKEKSLICLDADLETNEKVKQYNNVVLLPGKLPPDQLIFEHLYNLLPNDPFWQNELQFSRDVFTNIARDVLNEFQITGDKVDIAKVVKAYSGNKKPREIFKRFYKMPDFQSLVLSASKPYNPWFHWLVNNTALANDFLDKFKAAIYGIMKNGFGLDETKLAVLEVRHRN